MRLNELVLSLQMFFTTVLVLIASVIAIALGKEILYELLWFIVGLGVLIVAQVSIILIKNKRNIYPTWRELFGIDTIPEGL